MEKINIEKKRKRLETISVSVVIIFSCLAVVALIMMGIAIFLLSSKGEDILFGYGMAIMLFDVLGIFAAKFIISIMSNKLGPDPQKKGLTWIDFFNG